MNPSNTSSASSENESERSFRQGLSDYLRTRFQLVSIETQEALEHLQKKLLPAIISLVCLLGTYLLVLLASVSWLGQLLASLGQSPLLGWELAAIIIAACHLLIFFIMKKTIIQKPKDPLFEYSRAELERERAWLQENTPKKTH